MDHHRPVDLLRPMVATLKRVAELLNFIGGFTLMAHRIIRLVDSKISRTGVIIATLKQAGEVKTGSFLKSD